jgi:hypothetical protein
MLSLLGCTVQHVRVVCTRSCTMQLVLDLHRRIRTRSIVRLQFV